MLSLGNSLYFPAKISPDNCDNDPKMAREVYSFNRSVACLYAYSSDIWAVTGFNACCYIPSDAISSANVKLKSFGAESLFSFT